MSWISVKDRLPDSETQVLALRTYIDGFDMQTVTYYHHLARPPHTVEIPGHPSIHLDASEEREGWSCFCEENYYGLDEFTHWMPLPEPPKESK